LEKGTILATIQFRMFHVLIYETDIFAFILSYVKRRTQIEGLCEQGSEKNI